MKDFLESNKIRTPAWRKGFSSTPWKNKNNDYNEWLNLYWRTEGVYFSFFLKTKTKTLYLLLVQPVQLHPPPGLISMCRNLLKKYQTSPDMHCNKDSYPVFVRHLSCHTFDDWTKNIIWHAMADRSTQTSQKSKILTFSSLLSLPGACKPNKSADGFIDFVPTYSV